MRVTISVVEGRVSGNVFIILTLNVFKFNI